MDVITSHSNPKIKMVRALRQRKGRLDAGLFIVEGIRPVGELVEAAASGAANAFSVQSIYYAPELLRSDFALALVADQADRGVACQAVSADVFSTIAEKDNPQGILALGSASQPTLADLSPATFSWGVALVSPQDPGNVGAILRSIDAVGASGLLLLDSSVDPYHPSAVRASMGALFWHPVVAATFDDFAAWARRHGYQVYGASAHGSTEIDQVLQYRQPLILLLGSERQGLTSAQAEICQGMLRLPMHGRVTSLNLAVAAGVLLYDMLAKPRPLGV